MLQVPTRRRALKALAAAPWMLLATAAAGCGGDPDQRKSGTLVMPLESVERAGEAAGKKEDERKKAAGKK